MQAMDVGELAKSLVALKDGGAAGRRNIPSMPAKSPLFCDHLLEASSRNIADLAHDLLKQRSGEAVHREAVQEKEAARIQQHQQGPHFFPHTADIPMLGGSSQRTDKDQETENCTMLSPSTPEPSSDISALVAALSQSKLRHTESVHLAGPKVACLRQEESNGSLMAKSGACASSAAIGHLSSWTSMTASSGVSQCMAKAEASFKWQRPEEQKAICLKNANTGGLSGSNKDRTSLQAVLVGRGVSAETKTSGKEVDKPWSSAPRGKEDTLTENAETKCFWVL